jgi:type I restriction enzyme, R subunit
LFADPEFDGDPVKRTKQTLDPDGTVIEQVEETPSSDTAPDTELEQPANESVPPAPLLIDKTTKEPRKYYVDGMEIWIMGEQAYELGPEGNVLRTVQYTDYTRDYVRQLSPTAEHLSALWPIGERRAEIIEQLAQRGIDLDALADVTKQTDADPLDLLLHVAYNAPLRTRRERAQQLRSKRANFFNTFTPAAREVLDTLLDKYADYGVNQLTNWNEVLKIPPLVERYSVLEIAALFGGPEGVKAAVEKMQTLLYE